MESLDKTLQLHTINTMVVSRKSTCVTDLQVSRLVLLEILFLLEKTNDWQTVVINLRMGDGEGSGKEAQQGGDVGVPTADSC